MGGGPGPGNVRLGSDSRSRSGCGSFREEAAGGGAEQGGAGGTQSLALSQAPSLGQPGGGSPVPGAEPGGSEGATQRSSHCLCPHPRPSPGAGPSWWHLPCLTRRTRHSHTHTHTPTHTHFPSPSQASPGPCLGPRLDGSELLPALPLQPAGSCPLVHPEHLQPPAPLPGPPLPAQGRPLPRPRLPDLGTPGPHRVSPIRSPAWLPWALG